MATRTPQGLRDERFLERAKLPPVATAATGRRKRAAEGRPRKNFPCQACQKAFNSVEKLKVHSYSHTGERPYRCSHPDCAKAFVSKYKLLRHTATHSPEKNHKCSYCEKMFHRKDHLKNHLHTHDPYKEAFGCQECGKSYNTKLGFKRHLALHAANSGDLTCRVCLQPFASTPVLLEHLRTHAGKSSGGAGAGSAKEKKHRCEHCERRFYTRKDVRRHMVVHTGRKDFLCQYCAQRFGRKDHLTRHMKKSHARELLLRVKAEPADTPEDVSAFLIRGLAPLKGEAAPPPPLQLNLYAGAGPDVEPFPGPAHPLPPKYPPGLGYGAYGAPTALEREQGLKGELETYLMELPWSAIPSSSSSSSSSSVAAAEDASKLRQQAGAVEDSGASPASKMATPVASEALASSSSLVDFSQLFNYLPLSGPPYHLHHHQAGGGPLGAPSYVAPDLVQLPMPQPPEGPEGVENPLQGLASSLISSLGTPTTLPRFHHAFQ